MLSRFTSPRVWALVVAFAAMTVMLIAQSPSTGTSSTAQPTPFPRLAVLPTPSLPDWIAQISPIGSVISDSQVRVRFKEPLIALQAIESPDQQRKLGLFELEPRVPGSFRFLTPRLVGFEPDRQFPFATNFHVRIKRGLTDLAGHRLAQDIVWSFSTDELDLGLPAGDHFRLEPSLEVSSNVELVLSSLQRRLTVSAAGRPIEPITVVVASPGSHWLPEPQASNGPENNEGWSYRIKLPALQPATHYHVSVAAGVEPAWGNIISNKAFDSNIETYEPLAFMGLGQHTGYNAWGGPLFVTGTWTVDFNNALRSGADVNTIAVRNDSGRLVTGGSTTLNPNVLRPATHYIVTIDPSITDEFGQQLGKPVTADFFNGDYSPDFWAPDGFRIIAPGSDLGVRFAAINLPSNSYASAWRVMLPEDLVYFASAEPSSNDPRQRFSPGLLPLPDSWAEFPARGTRNTPLDIAMPLQRYLGGRLGLLAYGARASTYVFNDYRGGLTAHPTYYGMVQITDLGVFAEVLPEAALVRVHRLSDGESVAGASVALFIRHDGARERPEPTPCATGVTDGTGIALFEAPAVAACRKGSGAPQLLAVVRSGGDWAFVRMDASDSRLGVSVGWSGGEILSRGALFPDRDLYQPGETATFTCAAFYLKDDDLVRDAGTRYEISLIDDTGAVKHIGTRTTNAFGTFSITVPLARAQKPGNYRIQAYGASGNQMYGDFRVAEFKPPTFKLDVRVDRHVAVAGESVVASGAGSYLFGSPLSNAKASWFVTRAREPKYFFESAEPEWMPARYRDYAFGKLWIPPEKTPELSSDVLKTVRSFDAGGHASVRVPIDGRIPYPLRYTVELEASDASARSVALQAGFEVIPAPEMIGLSIGFQGFAGLPATVSVIVLDRRSSPVAGRHVHLALERRRVDEHDKVTYTLVARAAVTSAAEPAAAMLTPPEPGEYRVVANFPDARDDAGETDAQLFVVQKPVPTPTPQPTPTERPLTISFANPSPRPGDTEDVDIDLPFDNADVFMAVLRHKLFEHSTTRVTNGHAHFAFTVTSEMAPNVYFEVEAVRRGKPLNGVTAAAWQTLSQVAASELPVDTSAHKLQASVRPLQRSLEPGAAQTLVLTLRDAAGHGARGEFAVAVVDESVLQLTQYRPPDLFTSVWAAIPASLLVADNRQNVMLAMPESQLLSRFGYRPGQLENEQVPVPAGMTANVYSVHALKALATVTMRAAAQAGNTPAVVVRKNFAVLAYYNGSVVTNDAGEARVSFRVPDSLTSWRVTAVAVGAPEPGGNDLRFGRADASFVTRKPLAANPLLPQFVRPNDRFKPGVNITNDTGKTGAGRIIGILSGPLGFETDRGLTRTIALDEFFGHGTFGRRVDARATGWGTGRVQFEALLGSSSDAFEASVPLLPFEATEYAVETGTTTTRASIPLNVDPAVDPDVGGLDVTLASTLLPEVTVPAMRSLGNLDIPLLEPSASRLSIAANLIVLDKRYKRPVVGFDPAQIAALQLEHLTELQNADGGFSYWPGSVRSDPWSTAYAAESLGRARTAGVAVDDTMTGPLKKYLRNVIDNPSAYVPAWCDVVCVQRLRLESMLGLLALGEQRSDHLADVFAVRNSMDFGGRVKLARLLTQTPGWQTQAKALTAKLQEVLYETGRSATVDTPQGWWWYDSVICTQAQMLRLFVVQRTDPEVTDKVLVGLLGRLNGVWINGYDVAQSLTAIVDYAGLEPTPPDFSATTTLAGHQLAAVFFKGYERTSQDVNIPMSRLPRSRSYLVLAKSGTGRLHYVVQYGYRLKGAQAGRVNGFRVERRVTAAGQSRVLSRVGLAPPAVPTVLRWNEMFDIDIHIIVDHPVDHLIVTDPLPAGLEAVDQSFRTATAYYQAASSSWGFCYQTIYRDRVVLYADQLGPGTYDVHYLARSVTPGYYQWPGASASLLYAPEEFGRTASATLIVAEASR